MIRTPRLFLTSIALEDADEIRRLAGDTAIARNALDIPHPFEQGMAEAWIQSLRAEDAVFAIRTAEQAPLVGLIGLIRDAMHERAELSYWIGRAHWGHGFASEAVQAIVAFGFTELGLKRLFATSLARNAASARVLEKAGFRVEGCLRRHVKHWGEFEDLVLHGFLRAEYGR